MISVIVRVIWRPTEICWAKHCRSSAFGNVRAATHRHLANARTPDPRGTRAAVVVSLPNLHRAALPNDDRRIPPPTDRRIADRATLKAEVTAWNRDRNAAATTIDWRFTTADARIKLKHLYPAIHP